MNYRIRRNLKTIGREKFLFQDAILGNGDAACGGADYTVFSQDPEGFSRYIFEFRGDARAGRPKLMQCIAIEVIGTQMPFSDAT